METLIFEREDIAVTINKQQDESPPPLPLRTVTAALVTETKTDVNPQDKKKTSQKENEKNAYFANATIGPINVEHIPRRTNGKNKFPNCVSFV